MNIKKIITVIALACITQLLSAQSNTEGVSIAPNVTPPHSSAMLDVKSTNKGILIPRVTLTDVTISAPVQAPIEISLMVYNDGANSGVSAGYYYWDGVKWVPLGNNENITIKHKIVDMGPFDLTTPGSFGVSHGLPDHTKILDYKILINDDNGNIYSINYMDWNSDGKVHGSVTSINVNHVGFALRGAPSFFKSGDFNSLSISRGKVFITYYE